MKMKEIEGGASLAPNFPAFRSANACKCKYVKPNQRSSGGKMNDWLETYNIGQYFDENGVTRLTMPGGKS